ncbi:MAG: XisI protein [Timaviella obliquedivisa GSE-PSE-MK23-08B]|nr:XisI protein [Timaviella obliquedivisa GSE-PSE-MK23-08B]
MDKLNYYRQCLRKFLTDYASHRLGEPSMETQVVFDQEHDHYLLLRTGWEQKRRVHSCIFHFDIKEEKIWLQENNTDIDIGDELEEMGISRQEIVVGFHHPSLRQYSQYAVS